VLSETKRADTTEVHIKSPMTSTLTTPLSLLQVTYYVPPLLLKAQETSLIQRAPNTVTAKTWADGHISSVQRTQLTMWTVKWPV